jgi:hypothetical protein
MGNINFLSREIIIPQDLEIIGDNLDDILSLIDQNPFSERIWYLLKNENIAKIPVKNIVGEYSPPNCIGTAFFIAGVGELDYPYHGYGFELNDHISNQSNNFFKQYLERRIQGAFAFSYSTKIDSWHAGIYLGKIKNEHVFFAQHGHAESFGPESLRNFSSIFYEIPKTLLHK